MDDCVDHTTMYRWVQRSAPELEKRCWPHLKTTNDSWRVDQTSIKIRKVWTSLSRAVDSNGNTIAFLLSSTRDAQAAKRFFLKALHCSAGSALQTSEINESPTPSCDPTEVYEVPGRAPRVINVDKNAAYPKAIPELKSAGVLPQDVELRHVKYLNNLIEQDHRFIKRLTKPGRGFFSLETAWRTLQGFQIINIIRKGQVQGVGKGDVRGLVALVAKLFAVAASFNKGNLPTSSRLLQRFCNTTFHCVSSTVKQLTCEMEPPQIPI